MEISQLFNLKRSSCKKGEKKNSHCSFAAPFVGEIFRNLLRGLLWCGDQDI